MGEVRRPGGRGGGKEVGRWKDDEVRCGEAGWGGQFRGWEIILKVLLAQRPQGEGRSIKGPGPDSSEDSVRGTTNESIDK